MISERLKRLSAYTPGEQPQDRKYTKLNTNESPYPPSPLVKHFLETFDAERLRLYPDPLSDRLRERIAETYGVRKEQVLASNGSDEALSFCFYAFFDSLHGKLIFPQFTYSFYPVYCDFYGIEYEKVPLDQDFFVDVEEFLKRNSCGIIFANPNAPTGTCLPLERIRCLLERYPREKTVIVDEAYIDFGGESAVKLIEEFGNLVIVRTFSKSMSLAGLRLGFVLAREDLITALFTVKDSFNSYPVDMLSQHIGEIALSDNSYYRSMREKIITTREQFRLGLLKLGWSVLPSKANFVFAGKPGIPGRQVYQVLKENGFLVRYFNIDGIMDFVRITIGMDEDMQRLLQQMEMSF